VLYFQTFSRKDIPTGLVPKGSRWEKPDKTLEYYQSLEFPFAPGIRPRW
jgi:alpha-glucuronidase